jgi:hypothetical protein
MKHVCVAAKTVDNAKGAEADIAHTAKPPDKVSGRFDCNPKGWHDFSPICASCSQALFSIWPSSHSLI